MHNFNTVNGLNISCSKFLVAWAKYVLELNHVSYKIDKRTIIDDISLTLNRVKPLVS